MKNPDIWLTNVYICAVGTLSLIVIIKVKGI